MGETGEAEVREAPAPGSRFDEPPNTAEEGSMQVAIPTDLQTESPAVRTDRVAKAFGETAALDGVGLTVPEGSVYVLVGPNGAGKTTLLRVLLDLLRPDAGRAEVLGHEPRRRPAEVRARIGYVPERQDFHYGWMTAEHLVRHHASYYPAWDEEYARDLIERLDVPTGRKFARLSKGQARRVQLVLALAARPPLLLLDEPTDGLDPMGKKQVLGLIADHLASTPTTVLVSTHLVYEVERLGDHLALLHEGRLAAQVSRDELESRMKRYVADVPAETDPAANLELPVLERKRTGRELQVTLWGDEDEMVDRLEGAGATVHEVSRLSLEEATLTLMEHEEPGSEVRR